MATTSDGAKSNKEQQIASQVTKSSEKNNSTIIEQAFVTQLNSNDVLFGRGSGPNDHEGNIRFRSLVSERKAEYMATNHRQTKAKIAREIVNAVFAKNGRFLKKIELAEAKRLGLPKGLDAWSTVDDDTIMEKAKQALRQQRDKNRGTISPTPRSPKPASASNNAASTSATATSAPMRKHGSSLSPVRVRSSSRSPPPLGTVRVQTYTQPLRPPAESSNVQGRSYSPIEMNSNNTGINNPFEPIPIGPGGPNATLSAGQTSSSAYVPGAMDTSIQGQNDFGSRRESIQVQDLMDSFNKMKTKGLDNDDPRNHYESTETMGTYSTMNRSTDTMGTIEMTKESLIGMITSSTFSLPKSMQGSSSRDSVMGLGDSAFIGPTASSTSFTGNSTTRASFGTAASSSLYRNSAMRVSATSGGGSNDGASGGGFRRESIHIEDKDFFVQQRRSSQRSSDMSLSLSQVWNDKPLNVLGGVAEGTEDEEEDSKRKLLLKGGEETNNDEQQQKQSHQQQQRLQQQHAQGDPRQLKEMVDEPDNLSTLGKSSMSILNFTMGESAGGDSGILTATESIFSDIGD